MWRLRCRINIQSCLAWQLLNILAAAGWQSPIKNNLRNQQRLPDLFRQLG